MYLLFKLVHIAAVVVFLGNVTTGLFWHAHAARTPDPKLLRHTMDGIIRSDRLFTLPGVIVITIAGLTLALQGNIPTLRTGWLLWTLVLFSVSGIIFALRVAPLQRELRSLAQIGAQAGGFDYSRYRARAVRWEAWGALALLTPAAGLVLMVLKPNV